LLRNVLGRLTLPPPGPPPPLPPQPPPGDTPALGLHAPDVREKRRAARARGPLPPSPPSLGEHLLMGRLHSGPLMHPMALLKPHPNPRGGPRSERGKPEGGVIGTQCLRSPSNSPLRPQRNGFLGIRRTAVRFRSGCPGGNPCRGGHGRPDVSTCQSVGDRYQVLPSPFLSLTPDPGPSSSTLPPPAPPLSDTQYDRRGVRPAVDQPARRQGPLGADVSHEEWMGTHTHTQIRIRAMSS